MTNIVFQIKPKTYQEMWQADRELLKPVMKVDADELEEVQKKIKKIEGNQEGFNSLI